MPAYSGVANGDWVVKDAVSRPGDITDDTMRVNREIERMQRCVWGLCQMQAAAFCAYSSSGEACESSPLCTLR